MSIILPIFAIIITGWLLRTMNYVSDAFAEQLRNFACCIGAPALLLFSLGSVSFDQIWYWEYVGVFGVVTLGVFLILAYLATVVMKKSFNRVACGAFAVTVSRIGLFGLPFLYGIFGRRAMVPAALTLIMAYLIYAVVVFIFEIRHSKTGFEGALRKAGCAFFCNCLIIASIIGILYSLTGFSIPDGVAKYLRFFEVAFVPVALFAFGAQLDFKGFAKDFTSEFWPVVWKLAVMPALILWVGYSFGIHPTWLVVGVLLSGVATSHRALSLGKTYSKDGKKTASDRLARIYKVTSVCSVVTLFFWLLILANMFPGEFR